MALGMALYAPRLSSNVISIAPFREGCRDASSGSEGRAPLISSCTSESAGMQCKEAGAAEKRDERGRGTPQTRMTKSVREHRTGGALSDVADHTPPVRSASGQRT